MMFLKVQTVLIATVLATASAVAQQGAAVAQQSLSGAVQQNAAAPAQQSTATPSQQSGSAPVQQSAMPPSGSESLLIGSGDMLHITVFDTPELEQHARVTDDGNVPLIFLGNLHVVGLTPEAASRAIETGLKQRGYLKNPQVTVLIEQYSTQSVLVIGEVKTPGNFQIDTARPVLDVLGLAGGTTDVASRHITIQRRGTGERVQYFVSNNPEEAFDHSVLVYPGDKVMVPKAPVAYALGNLNKPGGFPFNNNDGQLTVLQMVSLAGGMPPTSKLGDVHLIRRNGDGYQEIPLDLGKMQRGQIADMQLQANDIVYVPFSFMKSIGYNITAIVAAAGGAAIYATRP
jgi:polysaccharide biosynthesis/export protein